MIVSVLAGRATFLQQELQNANETVQSLSVQLQQATLHLHTVNGHLQEVAYLMGEEQKEAGLVPSETSLVPLVDTCKEQEDVKVNEQVEEQASQE